MLAVVSSGHTRCDVCFRFFVGWKFPPSAGKNCTSEIDHDKNPFVAFPNKPGSVVGNLP